MRYPEFASCAQVGRDKDLEKFIEEFRMDLLRTTPKVAVSQQEVVLFNRTMESKRITGSGRIRRAGQAVGEEDQFYLHPTILPTVESDLAPLEKAPKLFSKRQSGTLAAEHVSNRVGI